jgi:hypothetical protein
MLRHCAPWLLAASVGLLLGGCATVEAWERGVLARPHMAPDPRPMRSSLRAHVQTSREAAPPAGVGDGGGCGCY